MWCSHGCAPSMVSTMVPIVHPFRPGADYGRAEYPDGCVVVDNPPFSILAKIIRFYQAHGVRFSCSLLVRVSWSGRVGERRITSFFPVDPNWKEKR